MGAWEARDTLNDRLLLATQQLSYHGKRYFRRYVQHEVALVEIDNRVQHVARDPLDLGHQPENCSRGEPPTHDRPLLAVLRRIHREQMPKGRLLLFAVASAFIGENHYTRSIGEQLWLFSDLYDIGVLRNRPERFCAGPLVSIDRPVLPQERPFTMRIAVLLVAFGGR
jgi:hypothetical protein